MKKHTPSRLAPSKLTFPKRAPSKRAPSRLASSGPAPSRRLPVLALVLVLAALLAAVGGTVAIYSSQAFLRNVVRNRDTEAIRFSSDKLDRSDGSELSPVHYYPLPEGSSNTMTFRVCNYDQDKSTLYNEDTITYQITFVLTSQDPNWKGDSSYQISTQGHNYPFQKIEDGKLSLTLDGQELPGKQSSFHAYTLAFYETDYKDIQLSVTVTPTNSSTTSVKMLQGTLIPIAYADTQGITVQIEYPDSGEDRHPKDFAAYNVLVSVSGGAANVVITWDHNQLDIDPFFLDKLGRSKLTKTDTESSIPIPMDPEQGTDTYLIQFYNHTAANQWEKWKDLPISVAIKQPASSEEQLSQT